MKLLLVSSGFPPRGLWGTEQYAQALASGLASRGHEVAVLFPRTDRSRPEGTVERSEQGGLELLALHVRQDARKRLRSSYENPRAERAFRELLAARAPDAVHFLYLLWTLPVGLVGVCHAAGIPALVTATDLGLLCHRGQMVDARGRECGGPHPAATCARCIREPPRWESPPTIAAGKRWAAGALALAGGAGAVVVEADVRARERAVARALEAACTVIAPTRALERLLLQAGVARAKLVHLVYAFDERPLIPARAEPPGRTVRIGYFGQLAPHKGPATLLRAVGILERRLPESVEPWEVHLHGEAPADRHGRYAAAILRGRHGARVQVLGLFAGLDLPRVLGGLHALVVPSEWMENAPLAALEARAAGVPVVAGDVPGLREILEPGVHGLLFPPRDALALADALREVILRRVGRSARPGLPLAYGEHLERVEALYERAVSARSVSV